MKKSDNNIMKLITILCVIGISVVFAQAVKTGHFDVLVPNNPASTFIDIGADLSINGSTVKIADIVDDDTLAADSATSLVTEQAIKAYVDSSIAGSGDVVGPASATDNAMVIFDGVTGKLVKNSTVTVSASGDISGIEDLKYVPASTLSSITARSSDSSDTYSFAISGGGAVDADRGGWSAWYGNEHGVKDGSIINQIGNDALATFDVNCDAGVPCFQINTNKEVTIGEAGNSAQHTVNSNLRIVENLTVFGGATDSEIEIGASGIYKTSANPTDLTLSGSAGGEVVKLDSASNSIVLGANPDKLNLLFDPSFERSIAEGSCIFCTAAAETSVKLPTGENTGSLRVTQASGLGAYTVNKTTGSEYLATQVAASCWIKTSATGIQFKALSNAAPVVTKEVSSDGNWNEYTIPFVAGTTSIGYQVTGGAASDVIYVDECFLGAKNVLNKLGYDTEWQSYRATFTGLGTVSTQRFKYRRSGDSIEVKGYFVVGTPTVAKASVSLPAGLSIDTFKVEVINNDTSVGQNIGLIQGTGGANFMSVVLTAPLSSTTAVYFGGTDVTPTQLIPTNGSSFSGPGTEFSLFFKVPIQGWQATFDTISDVGDPLYVSGKIYDSAGGNITATSSASPTIWTDADLVMELSNGSAEIPCSGSNPPTGLTCSTGSEQVGIAFTNKAIGKHRICFTFSGQTGQIAPVYNRIVYTTAANSDIAQSTSSSLMGVGGANATSGNDLCEIFNISSIAEHKFVLAHESSTIDGVLYLDRLADSYERDFSFSVEQIDNQINAILKDVVTSPNSSNGKPVKFCASSNAAGAITEAPFGDWVNGNAVVSSTSLYTISLNSVFETSSNIICNGTVVNTADSTSIGIQVQSSAYNQVVFRTRRTNTELADTASGFNFCCHGVAP